MRSSDKVAFDNKYNEFVKIINDELKEIIPKKETSEKIIYEAMEYSILAGGKRIRPVLSLAVCEMLNGDIKDVLPFACAIEMIHTYSLIHDDLPAMDNDDLRRGKPTNHKVYGEAIAILAGDALLTYAFEFMTYNTLYVLCKENFESKIKAIHFIAKSSGFSGLIGGQVMDLEFENKTVSSEMLEYMNKCKTGALIKAAVLAPAIILGLDKNKMDCLDAYANSIGLAFQIKDDILDAESSFEVLGKKAGKDVNKGKATFVTLYGLNEAKAKLDTLINESISSLEIFAEKADFLKNLAFFIKERIK